MLPRLTMRSAAVQAAKNSFSQIHSHILTDRAAELVNKGPMAEQMAGLELLRYQSPDI